MSGGGAAISGGLTGILWAPICAVQNWGGEKDEEPPAWVRKYMTECG